MIIMDRNLDLMPMLLHGWTVHAFNIHFADVNSINPSCRMFYQQNSIESRLKRRVRVKYREKVSIWKPMTSFGRKTLQCRFHKSPRVLYYIYISHDRHRCGTIAI